MPGRFQLVAIVIIASLAGSPGCRRSAPLARSDAASDGNLKTVAATIASPEVRPEMSEAVLAAHFRGVGYLEHYQPDKAVEAFGEVHQLAPNWLPGAINLAIALSDRLPYVSECAPCQSRDRALDLLDGVLEHDPDNLHAHYCRGLIYDSAGLRSKARSDFQFVVDRDPGDADSWYMLGSTLYAAPDGPESDEAKDARVRQQIAAFQRALECNPYLTGATYKLAMTYRLAGDSGALRHWLERWKELLDHPRCYESGDGTAYHDERPRYAVVTNPVAQPSLRPGSNRLPRFAPETPLNVRLKSTERWASTADFAGPLAVVGKARARFGAPVTVFDANNDGRLDLFLTSAIAGDRGVRDVLLLNDGDGVFEDATERLGLPMDHASVGAAAGDFDADGKIDLFLTGMGDNRLLHNEGKAGFKDITKAAGIAASAAVSLAARWLDLDEDGDLDLYVVNYAGADHANDAFTGRPQPGTANTIFRNDGKPSPLPDRPDADWAPAAVAHRSDQGVSTLSLTFNPWPEASALEGGIAAHTGIAMLDLDGDRDLDLVVASEGAAPQAILNDRHGRLHTAAIEGGEPGFGARGLLAINFDGDELTDIVSLDADGRVSAWRNQTQCAGRQTSLKLQAWACNARDWRFALAADLDLDGRADIVGLTSSELPIPRWARNDSTRLVVGTLPISAGHYTSASHSLQGLSLADVSGDGLADLILVNDGEAPRAARNLGNDNHWLAVALRGQWYAPGRWRSNPHGTGARVSVIGPRLSSMFDATTVETGLAQSVVPIVLGLGEEKSAAVLRIRWPDRIRQCEIDVAADQKIEPIQETHRSYW